VDLSALIFVALAVAWAVYLIPKALKHHEIDRVSRSVESFSDRVRVLAHREPVSADKAALVVGRPGTTKAAAAEVAEPESDAGEVEVAAAVAPVPPTRAQLRARKLAAARAAQRRRRVLGTILFINLAVVVLAAAGTVGWVWEAIPATLLVAWLVACRLMVRKERALRARTTPVRKRRTTLADQALAAEDAGDSTEEIPAVRADAATAEPGGWDPVPVTLPTYVGKAAAGRTVRTIDLDSTGVWSSGRNAADSALAREADQQRTEQAEPEKRRASGA